MSYTPSIFKTIHLDTMHMTAASNGCKYIVHGRCALSTWMEGRPLRKDNHKLIGQWLFEEVICRWGCIRTIVTDNAGQFTKVAQWLETKYGIKGIRIAAYNSHANGRIERPHWDVRQALFKACEDRTKWYWYFWHVMWADRITIRKRFGCSSFFMVTGAHPILPLDLLEATWLLEWPDGPLTMEELIGLRAQALAKHYQHVEEMRTRLSKEKLRWAEEFTREHERSIKPYQFKPKDLVLVRNMVAAKSLSGKMEARYWGPMVILARTKGGNYLVAELDGSVWQEKVAAFRVLPYKARQAITLPGDVEDWIDIRPEKLRELANEDGNSLEDNEVYLRNVHLDGLDYEGEKEEN